MSDIKIAFISELKNTVEYQEIVNFKQIVLDEILKPSVQVSVKQNFENEKTEYQLDILKMCSIIEFGFECIVTPYYIAINMKDFLKTNY